MAVVTEHTIDIEGILTSKVGDKMKYIPKFLVNWLIRPTHQEELNEFIDEIRYDTTGYLTHDYMISDGSVMRSMSLDDFETMIKAWIEIRSRF